MKKSSVFCLIMVGCFVTHTLSAQEDTAKPTSQKLIGLELAKPLFWFMKDLGLVIEPEFGYHHKGMVYNASIGYSNINDELYGALDYENTGTYLKLGAGIQINYNREVEKKNILLFCANLVFSRYKESATVINGSSSYGFLGEQLEQQQSSRGIETYFTYRRDFPNNFYASISPQINVILSTISEEHFPVFYVPGFGIISDRNDGYSIGTSPFSEIGEGGTVGLSFKIGYRF